MIDFFKGIKIVNGEKGINIIKNVAMEAYVELASKADIKAALKLDSKRVDDRVIHSKFCDAHLVFFPLVVLMLFQFSVIFFCDHSK